MLRPLPVVYPELSPYCRYGVEDHIIDTSGKVASSHVWERMVLARGGSNGPKCSYLVQTDHAVN